MSGRLDGLEAVRAGRIRVPKGRKRPTEGRQEGYARPVAGDAPSCGLSPSRNVGGVSGENPARRSGAAIWRRPAEPSGRLCFDASCLDAGCRGCVTSHRGCLGGWRRDSSQFPAFWRLARREFGLHCASEPWSSRNAKQVQEIIKVAGVHFAVLGQIAPFDTVIVSV